VSEAWIERARRVARGEEEPPAGWQLVRGERPPLFDGDALRAVVAALVAILAWAGLVFREMVVSPLDPLALFMCLVALWTTLRALAMGARVAGRVAVWARAPAARLVLAGEGLWAEVGGAALAAAKDEIVRVVEHGTWQSGRAAGARYSPVYVVLAGAPHLELPPVFDATPGVLGERIMRWRGPTDPETAPPFPDPAPLASKVYEDAARGIRPPGTTVIMHGDGWIRRGPWATVLLGVAIVLAFARASPVEQAAIGGATVLTASFALLMVPLAWVWAQRRSMAPQLGMAMVATPAELLMRTAGGVLRVKWPAFQRASIDVRGRFSTIEGWAPQRSLVIKRKDGAPITYDEAFLGVPAEVALALAEAYASGAAQAALSTLGGGEEGVEVAQPAGQRGAEGEGAGAREAGDGRGEDDVPREA
jgi:hypothetical protein